MNIGFDLDKVFIDYPPLVPPWIIDRFYKKSSNGVLAYRIPSRPEQIIRRASHHPLLRPPIWKNILFIQEFAKNKKNKLFLISSRYNFLKDVTDRIISTYGFDDIFDDMYFNYGNKQSHIFKNFVINKLTIDRYVDDDLPLLYYLHKKNPDKQFFWLNRNKKRKITTQLFAITNLREIASEH